MVIRSDAPSPLEPVRAEESDLRERLTRMMSGTIMNFGLIQPNDHILVAVSGGKDSYTMLDLLWRLRQRAPIPFEILAFHLDQGQPGYDGRPLESWLREFGAPFHIQREDTYSMVLDQTDGTTKSFCGPCSRFRRGIIYTWAEKLGCNKVALGHHRDDALETLLMNLFFGGKLQAMPASYQTNNERYTVIRPLIECDQAVIAAYARQRAFPILPCNLCGSQDGLQRMKMRDLLNRMEAEHPNVRSVMMAALQNVRPTHLLDIEVRRAWDVMAHEFEPRR